LCKDFSFTFNLRELMVTFEQVSDGLFQFFTPTLIFLFDLHA
jgi:hypothetical protein